MTELTIGTMLYRYVKCGGVFSYKVIGIRLYDDQTMYELECQSCTHGRKCELLVGGKPDKLRYITLLNDDEDTQHYWHTDDTSFHLNKERAQLDLLYSNLSVVQGNISDLEHRLKREKESLARYTELANIAKEKLEAYANIPAIS